MLKKIFNGFLNFILPNTCLACDEPLTGAQNYLCEKCFAALQRYDEIHPWQKEEIAAGNIDHSMSVFWFREGTAIQQLFHALKYQKMQKAGILLGEEIGKLAAAEKEIKFDLIIPVPLHKARKRDRTYNQSESIAEGINNILGIEVVTGAVTRSRYTPTQTRLNRSERKDNVKGAFAVNPESAQQLRGKNIILTDDVITTGATILECASALKQAKCGKLWICSAAYAELRSGNI
ncbi:MAG TPA: ComF family protein [Ignavibacteria bacterium]|nr:ComF family protein [Ignavibacteria bacterium]HAX49871.1 hypothetical protein [Bacteroidota bacterium]HRE09289.1 ComF family protein [Ignavibacteria bacterium]HRF66250.1 ComF family protein [Ignavibacteria bacterium]HRJ03804.1 ComF family protein [Ignavibacteria bacterium]